jgi:hypothetical protein
MWGRLFNLRADFQAALLCAAHTLKRSGNPNPFPTSTTIRAVYVPNLSSEHRPTLHGRPHL